MSPNTKELFAIFNSVFQKDKSLGDDVREHYKVLGSKYSDIFTDLDESDLNEILKYLVQYVPVIILSRGKKNLKVACAYDVDLEKSGQFPNKENLKDIKTKNKKHIMQPVVFDFPVLKFEDNEKYMNESGAGDSMSSGIIYGILNDYTLSNTIYNGVLSAKLALLTTNNVNEEIGNINLEKLNKITDMNRDQIKKQNL
jgi:fructose-1-phosphate kinase PfkB-like protein